MTTTTDTVVHDFRFTCGLCRMATEIVYESEHRDHVEAFGMLGAADVELLDNLGAARVLSDYVSRVCGIEDCFDSWSDESLIVFDEEKFTVNGETSIIPRNTAPIGDAARAHLKMAADWYSAASSLADDFAELGGSGGVTQIPDGGLRGIAETEIAAALAARNKVLVSWARLTLGTAGPTPTIHAGAYVETDGTAVHIRGDAVRTD